MSQQVNEAKAKILPKLRRVFAFFSRGMVWPSLFCKKSLSATLASLMASQPSNGPPLCTSMAKNGSEVRRRPRPAGKIQQLPQSEGSGGRSRTGREVCRRCGRLQRCCHPEAAEAAANYRYLREQEEEADKGRREVRIMEGKG